MLTAAPGRPFSLLRGLVVVALGHLGAASGCAAIDHASTITQPPAMAATPKSWDDVFAHPAEVDVDVIVSARWAVRRSGVLNQNDPRAAAAGPGRKKVPIILPVGVVRHATKGDFLVDTGIERATAKGERGAVRGLLRSFLGSIEPVVSLGEIIERDQLKVAGVLLTHLHIDHVLGLPDLPKATPLWVGVGETKAHQRFGGLQRRTFDQLLADRPPVHELRPEFGIALGPIPHAIDLLGDGSIWGISSPGHTPGSMAWLINARTGPVLFVGDTSHTKWGWDHDVAPGKFSDDIVMNDVSLANLRALVKQYPRIRVVLGHELVPVEAVAAPPVEAPAVEAPAEAEPAPEATPTAEKPAAAAPAAGG